MGVFIDLTGQRFGRWLVLHRCGPATRQNGVSWLCKCDCGSIGAISGNSLRHARSRSCGCIQAEVAAQLGRATRTHGLSHSNLCLVRSNMLQRCYNPKTRNFSGYGGRGIAVCAEWRTNPKAFYDWAMKSGYVKGLQIDRRNNDGNYEPSNCRFVTPRENCLNTRRQHGRIS